MTRPAGAPPVPRPTGARGDARDIVMVYDGPWTERLARILAGRGHRVRHVDPPLRAAALHRAAREAGPAGVLITSVAALGRVRPPVPRGVRIVMVCRDARRPGTRAHRHAIRWGECADRFLALTAEEADRWAEDGLANAGAMPDPVAPPDFAAHRPEPIVVATVPPGHPYGLDLLLEAWARVAPRHPAWRLLLTECRDGADALRRQAERLGVRAAVEFGSGPGAVRARRGRWPRAAVVPASPAPVTASVFAYPARTVEYPAALAEAMAQGLPAVAFGGAPGVRELITHGVDGLLVTPGNTVEFAAALDRLLAREGMRRALGRRARASARRYAPEAVADRWDRLFALMAP